MLAADIGLSLLARRVIAQPIQPGFFAIAFFIEHRTSIRPLFPLLTVYYTEVVLMGG
jgi:hypothetical protein